MSATVLTRSPLTLLATTLSLAACASSPSQSSAAASSKGSDAAGAAICPTPAYAITTAGACRAPVETSAPFCETPGLGQGLYVLCAVSPAGQMFVFGASGTATLSSDDGWTFGPSDWVPSIFELAPLSGTDAALCHEIAITISPETVPTCGSDGG